MTVGAQLPGRQHHVAPPPGCPALLGLPLHERTEVIPAALLGQRRHRCRLRPLEHPLEGLRARHRAVVGPPAVAEQQPALPLRYRRREFRQRLGVARHAHLAQLEQLIVAQDVDPVAIVPLHGARDESDRAGPHPLPHHHPVGRLGVRDQVAGHVLDVERQLLFLVQPDPQRPADRPVPARVLQQEHGVLSELIRDPPHELRPVSIDRLRRPDEVNDPVLLAYRGRPVRHHDSRPLAGLPIHEAPAVLLLAHPYSCHACVVSPPSPCPVVVSRSMESSCTGSLSRCRHRSPSPRRRAGTSAPR